MTEKVNMTLTKICENDSFEILSKYPKLTYGPAIVYKLRYLFSIVLCYWKCIIKPCSTTNKEVLPHPCSSAPLPQSLWPSQTRLAARHSALPYSPPSEHTNWPAHSSDAVQDKLYKTSVWYSSDAMIYIVWSNVCPNIYKTYDLLR